MPKQPVTPPLTTEVIRDDFAAFIHLVKSVTQPKPEERALFPGFQLTDDIRGKIQQIITLMQIGDMERTHSLLQATKHHFNCKQAAYVRGTLLSEVTKDLKWMTDVAKYPRGFTDPVYAILNEFRRMCNESYFELRVASELYWKVIDALNKADQEQEERSRKREIQTPRRSTAAPGRDQLKQKLEEQRRQEAARVADEMNELVSTL